MNILPAYKLISHEYIKEVNSEAYLLEHIKSGAHVYVLENSDPNKVFSIAFRTPVNDSTGVPHIIEHSVLCGSERFPVKDPFMELAKTSLNTFLNAITFPDKTVYPVASCNYADFCNLMKVYVDAVFKPNIYSNENIFRQEGWHYEVAEDGSLSFNGVVYNEMKGAMSDPMETFGQELEACLFPDTGYGQNYGGEPSHNPELSYEQFLTFHSKYYHPSNSYIYLYGDCDMLTDSPGLMQNICANMMRQSLTLRLLCSLPLISLYTARVSTP
ncbi:MAG: hypothetical protein KBS79_05610 [Lachnospiraceae bacterium]|nr:hypothetical protein [Candidatus Minthocola equi]